MNSGLRSAESETPRVRLLPVCITLMLLITAVLGINFSGENLESRPFFQVSSTAQTDPDSRPDVDSAPSVTASGAPVTPGLESVGFRPNRSADLIEDQYDLDYVRCEKCPYGHFGSSKEIGPKSPTYIGYHQGTEVRVRATFNDDFSVIKELVVVPPSDGISPQDLAMAKDQD